MPDWFLLAAVLVGLVMTPIALTVLWTTERRQRSQGSPEMRAVLTQLRVSPPTGMATLKALLEEQITLPNLAAEDRTAVAITWALIRDLDDNLELSPVCADPLVARQVAGILKRLDNALNANNAHHVYEALTNLFLILESPRRRTWWHLHRYRWNEHARQFEVRLSDAIRDLEAAEISQNDFDHFLEDCPAQINDHDESGAPLPYVLALVYLRHARRTFVRFLRSHDPDDPDPTQIVPLAANLAQSLQSRDYSGTYKLISQHFSDSLARSIQATPTPSRRP